MKREEAHYILATAGALNREEKVELLVNRDANTVEKCILTGEWDFIEMRFRNGFKGYNNFTDEELDAEIREEKALDALFER